MANRLLKAFGVVSAMTGLSRILGFVRDMLLAQTFGASASYDAFLVAFKIPNFMRRLFAEGAFSQAFIPVLSEAKTQQSMEEVRLLTWRVFSVLFITLAAVSALGMLFSGPLVSVFAPGFVDDARFTLASQLLQITFPYLLLISLTAFAAGILNTWRHFALPAFTPVLLNLALIGSALWLTGMFAEPVTALAFGVVIGGILQLALQLTALSRIGFFPRFRTDCFDPQVRKILRLMGPAILGASVMQINLLVDAIFASFLPVGSVTWLYYAERLLEFPLGMFAVALSTVILPHLSEQYAQRAPKAFSASLDWAFRWSLIIGLPCAIGLIVLRKAILVTLFQYGAFSAVDSQMCAQALAALASGLVAFITVKILISAFYAQQDTRFPFKVAVLALVSNVVLNSILIGPYAHVGLAMASAISAWINASVLFFMLVKRKVFLFQPGWFGFLIRLVLASITMCFLLLTLLPPAEHWEAWSVGHRILELSLIIGLGSLAYFSVLALSGLRVKHLSLKMPIDDSSTP